MDEKKIVSVIITTRNSSRTLDRCLSTINKQSYKNIELIVVDNNSDDDTKKIARKYTKKVFNKGPERSAQRNFGAKKARGKYLLIHDSDIYFHKDSVKECVELAEKTGCKAIILPEKSIGEGYWAKVKAFERSFYVGNDLIEAARFFDKKTYWEIGGYDEEITGPDDWDLHARFMKAGYKPGRTQSFLLHDEGKITPLKSSKKKRYYSNGFVRYNQKHPEFFKKQMSFFVRFPPNLIIKKGIRHPILISSMIFMKFEEWVNTR